MYAKTKRRPNIDSRENQRIASKSAEFKRKRLSDIARHIVPRAGGVGIIVGIITIPAFLALEITSIWGRVKSGLVRTSVLADSPELASHFPDYWPSISESPFISIAGATEVVAPSMKTGLGKPAASLSFHNHFAYTDLETNFIDFYFKKDDVGFRSLNLEAAIP